MLRKSKFGKIGTALIFVAVVLVCPVAYSYDLDSLFDETVEAESSGAEIDTTEVFKDVKDKVQDIEVDKARLHAEAYERRARRAAKYPSVPYVSVKATDLCGLFQNCLLSNLEITGGVNKFEKILDDGTSGAIYALNGPYAGTYKYSVKVYDKYCGGTFTIKPNVTSVELQIAKDGCTLVSVLQN